jgi:UDP-3-O-[3-hydroxymyristoyl] glucosamine N-acyltransferase
MEQKDGGYKMLNEYINNQVQKLIYVKQKLLENEELMSLIKEVALKCVDVYKNENKTLIEGNGGSAAEGSWIGTNVVILDDVTIWKNAVVGAGSVVTKNIADFTVVAGVPAKIMKYCENN